MKDEKMIKLLNDIKNYLKNDQLDKAKELVKRNIKKLEEKSKD